MNWKLLTAFEAAARHRNFSRAAAELNVQQPAISRRVAELEAELGLPLFHRTRPNVTVTREGDVLFRAIAGSFMQVQTAIEQIRRRPDRTSLTVNTTIGFASCYLMKRLPGFRSRHPGIDIELVSRDQNDAYATGTADVVIVFDAPSNLPGATQVPIFSETLVAAARPGAFPEVGDDIAKLCRHPLLHLSMGIHHNDWDTFLSGTGLVPPAPPSGQRFTSFMVYLQAALNGDGIMLGWETLMQDHFDLGQLVRISARQVRTERGYFACLMKEAQGDPAALAFLEWLSTSADGPGDGT